jgi:hypothetical protein
MQIGQDIIRQMETGDFTFTGIPNGSIPITIGVTDSFNLIGNPYPSALDADKFYRKIEVLGVLSISGHIVPL